MQRCKLLPLTWKQAVPSHAVCNLGDWTFTLRSRATMLNVPDQRVGQSFTTVRPRMSSILCVAMDDLRNSFTTDLALSRILLTPASFCIMFTTSCKVCTTHGVLSKSTWWYLRREKKTNKHKLPYKFLFIPQISIFMMEIFLHDITNTL